MAAPITSDMGATQGASSRAKEGLHLLLGKYELPLIAGAHELLNGADCPGAGIRRSGAEDSVVSCRVVSCRVVSGRVGSIVGTGKMN